MPILGRNLTSFVDRRWPGMRSSVVARTRLIDDWLSDAAREGQEQVVMLGAGLDTRAWRLPAFAGMRVYEVDHPSTSAIKQRRLAACGADLRHVRFVQVNFDRESLADRLSAAGFENSLATIVVWDGVTNYLQADAVDTVMRWAGSLSAGSTFIFTYIHCGILDGTVHFEGAERVRRSVSRSGESWTFGLRPETVANYLEERGLRLLADQDAGDYRRQIIGDAARNIRGYEFYHAARAEVTRHRQRAAQAEDRA